MGTVTEQSGVGGTGIANEPPSPPHRRAVSWRSLSIGAVGVVFICGLTAFNDYAVNNTYLTGSALPPGVLLFFLILVLGVNGPLRKWWPSAALSEGELAVALGMVLVSCALPSVGLMRYL